MLDNLLQRAGAAGVQELVIGMAHRGRLNVLVNTLGKKPSMLFDEFEGKKKVDLGSGDVKYHLGTSGDFTAESGEHIPVYLAANPSHLEAVNPVLEGIVRAKQDALPRGRDFSVLPILMHGDAAFAKIAADQLQALLKDKAKLTAVLTYHVVPGKVMSKDVKAGMVKTVQGSSLSVTTMGGVKVDSANVTSVDIAADNGVIHVIDSVVMPK